MKWKLLVVAALLLTGYGEVANAADSHGQKKKSKAQALIIMLDQMGIDNRELQEFAHYIDQKIDKGRFSIAEERRWGGTILLNYKYSGGDIGAKQLELRYTPDNSHFVATAGTREVMVRYRVQF